MEPCRLRVPGRIWSLSEPFIPSSSIPARCAHWAGPPMEKVNRPSIPTAEGARPASFM